jgi:hypothetical protein
MTWWVQLLWALAFTVVSELLRPKQRPGSPQPSSLDDFDLPTADETRAVPVVFGRCKVDGANVTWYGDLRVDAIKKKVKTGLFSSDNITTGYKYYLGIEMMLCHGQVDELVEVRFGDKVPNYNSRTVTADTITYDYNAPNLFGGNDKEGGVSGTLRFYLGTQTQVANAYLEGVRAKSLPAYKGFSYAALEQMYLGTSPYIKEISYIVGRYPNGLGLAGGKQRIGNDANAACMIYEILTNNVWGCGISSTLIDVPGLQTIGNTLYTEGLGLSMLMNGAASGRDILDEILRHIDGTIYTDPQTGLVVTKLARPDYVRANLPIYGPSEITSLNYSRMSWSETKNTIKVNYVSQEEGFTERTVQAQDIANVQARGGEIDMEQINFRGLSNATIANTVCNRALKTMSYPGAKYNLRINRKGWQLRPGSVFRLTWPEENIEDVVVRVIRIDYGDSLSQGIEIDAVEDIFAIDYNAYDAPAAGGWTDPMVAPTAVFAQHTFEAPYEVIKDASRYALIVCNRSNTIDEGFDVWWDPTGGTSYIYGNASFSFTPTALLTAEYSRTTASIDATGFVVNNARDFAGLTSADDNTVAVGQSLALIKSVAGEEIVAWKTLTNNGNGTYTISNITRGVYDTVPITHAAGARVWIISDGMTVIGDQAVVSAGSVWAKVLPFNAVGKLEIASATAISTTLADRAKKPYPAGNIKVNGVMWPTTAAGDAVITWAHRHRLTQAANGVIVAQDAANVTASPEGDYTLKIYVGGVLKQTVTALTGTTYTYTYAQRLAHDANTALTVEIGMTSINGSFSSAERKTTPFLMTGP